MHWTPIKLTGQPSDHGKLIKNNILAGGLTMGCPTAQSPTYNNFLSNFKMSLQKTGYNTECQKLRFFSTPANVKQNHVMQVARQMRPLRDAMPQINTIKNVYEQYETRGQPQNTMLHQGNIAYNDRGCKFRVK